MKGIREKILCSLSAFLLILHVISGSGFTFELEDGNEACFNEVVDAGVAVTFDYQVIKGGNLDVDVVVEGPNKEVIYTKKQGEYDTLQFNTNSSGEYIVCFSNQFSTFTHKVVFMSLMVGEEKSVVPETDHLGPLTFMEAASEEIHGSLNTIIDTQTHYRLQESQGRRFAEDLTERVLWWSLTETFVIVAISVSQVLILRNFFSDPVSSKPYPVRVREPRYARFN